MTIHDTAPPKPARVPVGKWHGALVDIGRSVPVYESAGASIPRVKPKSFQPASSAMNTKMCGRGAAAAAAAAEVVAAAAPSSSSSGDANICGEMHR